MRRTRQFALPLEVDLRADEIPYRCQRRSVPTFVPTTRLNWTDSNDLDGLMGSNDWRQMGTHDVSWRTTRSSRARARSSGSSSQEPYRDCTSTRSGLPGWLFEAPIPTKSLLLREYRPIVVGRWQRSGSDDLGCSRSASSLVGMSAGSPSRRAGPSMDRRRTLGRRQRSSAPLCSSNGEREPPSVASSNCGLSRARHRGRRRRSTASGVEWR